MIRWDDIDVIYKVPEFSIKKGSIVKIEVVLDTEIDDFDKENLPDFF